MTKVKDQFQIKDMTVLILTEQFPLKGWKNVLIGDDVFECSPVMGSHMDSLAVSGAHDFIGKSVAFV